MQYGIISSNFSQLQYYPIILGQKFASLSFLVTLTTIYSECDEYLYCKDETSAINLDANKNAAFNSKPFLFWDGGWGWGGENGSRTTIMVY